MSHFFSTPWTVARQAPLSMRLSRQGYGSGLLFPPPMDHVLSERSIMSRPSWVALHGVAHNFIEFHKPFHQNKAVTHKGRSEDRDRKRPASGGSRETGNAYPQGLSCSEKAASLDPLNHMVSVQGHAVSFLCHVPRASLSSHGRI